MSSLWRLAFIVLFLSCLALGLAIYPVFDNQLHFVVCDVGQGDGILIYRKSVQVIIDGGPDASIMKCLGKHMPFWDREIEAIVVTNPDLDHYEGFIDVLRNYKVDEFIWPGLRKSDASFLSLEKEIEDKKVKNHIITQGEVLKVGDLEFDTLWPTKSYLAESGAYSSDNITTKENEQKVLGAVDTKNVQANEWSIIFLLRYGQFKALLTGDIEAPAEDTASEYLNTQVDVLKVPHHGSKNGLDAVLLNKAKPKLAIISDGKNNKFGHPHKETLDLLQANNIKILRTDLDGEVEVVTDGDKWKVVGNK